MKSIIKGSTMRHALVAIWSMLIHGDIRGQSDVGNDPNEERPHTRTPSCFAVANRWPYPNAIQLRARPWLPIMIMTYG